MGTIAVLPEFQERHRHGTCVVCSLPRRDGDVVVDLGCDIDFEGSLAVCSTCVALMAASIGLMTPGQVDAMNADLTAMTAEVLAARRQIDRLTAKEASVDADRRQLRSILAEHRGMNTEAQRTAALAAAAG